MGIENDFRKSKEIEQMILGHDGAILVKIKESIAQNLIIKITPKITGDNYIDWSCETNFEEEFKFCNKALLSQKLFEQKIVYKKRKQTQKADEESRALTDMLGLDSTYEEIKARHILVKTKEEAEIIITDLANGADFTEIAKRKSIGESSSKGGSLGWFRAEHQVYNFAKAVDSMIKGSISKRPVLSQFGYHVIKIEDKRFTKVALK